MKVNIKEQEIELKRSYRSYIIYESITGGPFAPKNLTDMITYMYSVLLASKKDIEFTFDEFIDWLDEQDSNIVGEFTEWLRQQDNRDEQFNKAEKKSVKKTRKTTKQ